MGFARIHVSGGHNRSLALRALPDGSLDTTFHAPDGLDVQPPLALPHGGYQALNSADAASDGSLYACGDARDGQPSAVSNMLVRRYTPDGAPDPSFGQGGEVRVSLPDVPCEEPSEESCFRVVEAPDGKILVGGFGSLESEGGYTFAVVARLLHDGTLDPSFGEGGLFTTKSNVSGQVTDLLVLPGGDILAAGAVFDPVAPNPDDPVSIVLLRLRPDGTLATDFGHAGAYVVGPAGLSLMTARLALQADGKVLISGTTESVFVARLQGL